MEKPKSVKTKRTKLSYRDALVEEFARDYKFVSFTKGDAPDAFSIWFKKADFGYFDFCKFWDSIGMVGAKYVMRCKNEGILVEVSRYRGHL